LLVITSSFILVGTSRPNRPRCGEVKFEWSCSRHATHLRKRLQRSLSFIYAGIYILSAQLSRKSCSGCSARSTA